MCRGIGGEVYVFILLKHWSYGNILLDVTGDNYKEWV